MAARQEDEYRRVPIVRTRRVGMATGYTGPLLESEMSVAEFVWRCVRAMGLAYHMRDLDGDFVVPRRFTREQLGTDEEIEREREQITKTEKRIADLRKALKGGKALTLWIDADMKARCVDAKQSTEIDSGDAADAARCKAVADDCAGRLTGGLDGLGKFIAQQLSGHMRPIRSAPEKPKRRTVEDAKEAIRRAIEHDEAWIERCRLDIAKAEKRFVEFNAFLDQLDAVYPYPWPQESR